MADVKKAKKAHCHYRNTPLCYHHRKECDLVCIQCATENRKFVNICPQCVEEDHDGHKIRLWKKATVEEILSESRELKIMRRKAENMVKLGRDVFGKRRPQQLKSLEKFIRDCTIPELVSYTKERLIECHRQLTINLKRFDDLCAAINEMFIGFYALQKISQQGTKVKGERFGTVSPITDSSETIAASDLHPVMPTRNVSRSVTSDSISSGN